MIFGCSFCGEVKEVEKISEKFEEMWYNIAKGR